MTTEPNEVVQQDMQTLRMMASRRAGDWGEIMREAVGDLWTYPADVRVIPTNGGWRMTDGGPVAIMGAGVALDARRWYAVLPFLLGGDIRDHGIRSEYYVIPDRQAESGQTHLVMFPTKYHWRQKSDLGLIRRSAEELRELNESWAPDDVLVIPKVGCGLGGLQWSDVEPILASVLDDRFVVVSLA